MLPKISFLAVQQPSNLVEIWLKYEPFCADIYAPTILDCVAKQPLWDDCGYPALPHTATGTGTTGKCPTQPPFDPSEYFRYFSLFFQNLADLPASFSIFGTHKT